MRFEPKLKPCQVFQNYVCQNLQVGFQVSYSIEQGKFQFQCVNYLREYFIKDVELEHRIQGKTGSVFLNARGVVLSQLPDPSH